MNPNDPYVERTVIEQPAVVRREVEPAPRGGSSAGWWIAGLVAVVAIFGAVALVNNRNATDLQAAREAGRTEAMVDSATADAQRAAAAATGAASSAAGSMASAADSASSAAQSTADNARQAATPSAADTGADASTAAPAEPAQ